MKMKNLYENLINITFEEYKKILTKALKSEHKKMIVTANSETFAIAAKDHDFFNVLNNKKIDVIADGISLVKMSRFFNNKLPERMPGVEITQYLLEEANRLEKTVFLYGAEESVLNKLITVIKDKYQKIKILGYKNGYDYNRDETFDEIVKLNPDLCLVALGIPSQEKLIYKNLDRFKKGIFVGVGGSFDVISGTKKRSPKFFLDHNLEWLYRILKEPKRIYRFIKYNLVFIKFSFKKENNKNEK